MPHTAPTTRPVHVSGTYTGWATYTGWTTTGGRRFTALTVARCRER